MSQNQTVKVIVNETLEVQTKQGFPDVNKVLDDTSEKVKEFAVSKLSNNLKTTVANIQQILASIDNQQTPKLKSVTLTLSVDAKGEFSIIGSLKGGISAGSSLSLTFDL